MKLTPEEAKQFEETLDLLVQAGWVSAYIKRPQNRFSIKYSDKGRRNFSILAALLQDFAVEPIGKDTWWTLAAICRGDFVDE